MTAMIFDIVVTNLYCDFDENTRKAWKIDYYFYKIYEKRKKEKTQ